MELIFGSPQYYIQGAGILSSSANYIKNLGVGEHVLVLIDRDVMSQSAALFESLNSSSIKFTVKEFKDQITLDKVEELVAESRQYNYDVVLGVGGGKAIDVAKRISWALNTPNVAIPTSIATDAATSRTAVAYGLKNEIVEDKTLKNPDCIIVDSSVIINAPARLFNAGMADALSKRYEYILSLKCGEKNWYGGDPAFFINNISLEMHTFLLQNGRYLKKCFQKHILNETVERAITAMLLMSRIVWDAGGLKGAHDMFEEFHDAGFGDSCLHGEIVGYFDLVQLLLENYPENEFDELYDLYSDLEIPLRISEMGFPVEDKSALESLTNRMVIKCEKFNYHIDPVEFINVILKLENM